MFKWVKSLFGSNRGYEEGSIVLPKVLNIPPMPKVKPPKNVSEPVYAILKAWKDNPKRFSFSTDFKYCDPCTTGWYDSYTTAKFYDKVSLESFDFYIRLERNATKDYDIFFRKPPFTTHKLYVALGYTLISSPSWMTKDEVDYLEKNIVSYYIKRCERYIELIEYRKDRQRSQQNKLAQLTKQKERDRLMELYK